MDQCKLNINIAQEQKTPLKLIEINTIFTKFGKNSFKKKTLITYFDCHLFWCMAFA